ncbi:MAG: AmmeMemoRadiSam system protein A [Planctomycetes bacterium]|nr:AmmeMemoRadiSam system protein A [Planctomycetota bacterium]
MRRSPMPGAPRLDSLEDRRRLLELARAVAARHLGGGGDAPCEKLHVEGTFGGVFVTYWAGKTLRGCIGRFGRTTDISATVAEVAKASLGDRRFASKPITDAELATLTIEISILSDLVKTDDPLSLVPGTHGIEIRRGEAAGCFLPKVAVDRGWSAQEFLSHCCTMKAGLEADAWREPDTQVRLFTAEVFSDLDFKK